jgi:putative transposase
LRVRVHLDFFLGKNGRFLAWGMPIIVRIAIPNAMSRKPYCTDLSDEQWELLRPLFARKKTAGRPPKVDYREVVNALLYQNRTGCQYELLPHDFPPPGTVYYYFQRWRDNGKLQQIHDTLRAAVRQALRPSEPATACVDSQSSDSHGTHEARGFDGGKKVDGRKRHVIVDSLGMLLAVVVTAGNVSDAAGGAAALERLKASEYPRLRTIFGDKAYAKGGFPQAVQHWKGECELNVIARPKKKKGFVKLKVRWVVERTLGWLTKQRRLCRSYEHTVKSEEAKIHLAMTSVMLNRLKPKTQRSSFSYRKAA